MDKLITIVGVGALGSHVVQFSRNFGAKLRVIDFDRIEQKNTMSQFHGKPNVGKNKAQAIEQTMNFFFGVKVITVPHKLTLQNEEQLLSGSSLIIDCLDNGEARRIVQNFVRRTRIPCIHGALAADAQYGRVVWDHDFWIDDEPATGTATCENGEHLPFITLVSSLIARSIQEFVQNNRRIGFEINPAGVIRT